MANITTTGTTGYPGTIDTRTSLSDGAAGDQIVSAHPNGLGAAVLAIETELGTDPAGTVADVKTRLDVSQNSDGTIKSSVITTGGGAAVSYSAGVFTLGWSPDGPGYTQNIGLEITANAPVANAMRIRLVQRSGSTPTSTSPVRLAFKVATASASPAYAAYAVREVTSDTALVLSSGSSLGTLVNETARIYVDAIDNNGTVELAVHNPKEIVASTTAARVMQLWRPSEVATYTTTAEGGAGGADSAATLYSTSTRTGVYIRRLGYIDVTLGSTAGNWSNNPNGLTVIGPGTPVTGDIIQEVSTVTAVVRTGTTVAVNDGTTPQIAEGDLYIWATMTSTNPVNPIMLDSIAAFSTSSVATRMIAHVHRNSEANALLTSVTTNVSNGLQDTLSLKGLVATTTTGAAGYYYIFGTANGGTTTFNGEGGASMFGPSLVSYFMISEVCA